MYDVVEVGDLFVILHIYNKILSCKKNNMRTRQSASSKTTELYIKNKIDVTVYSEMQVVTLCYSESQVKIAEEQCKSDLSATPTCNMPLSS